MKKTINNVKDIKVGKYYRVYNPEEELMTFVKAEVIEPADELYGNTSVMVNDIRFDVFEFEVCEITEEEYKEAVEYDLWSKEQHNK